MKRFNVKNEKAITLVALIISVIILLILAGVTIASLTNSGLFTKTQEAVEQAKMAQYCEDLDLAILEAQSEAYTSSNTEFSELLNKKILGVNGEGGIDWVASSVIDSENDVITVTSEDGYVIEIDVNNSTKTATIDRDNIVPTGQTTKRVTISYNSNSGSGSMAVTKGREGQNITLRTNAFTRDGYIFDKWDDGNGHTYEDGATITVSDDTELTAQWIDMHSNAMLIKTTNSKLQHLKHFLKHSRARVIKI